VLYEFRKTTCQTSKLQAKADARSSRKEALKILKSLTRLYKNLLKLMTSMTLIEEINKSRLVLGKSIGQLILNI
tara:strand:- start:149 stop:370 length:222 start_codon:yes stop_codon:yes gene_type:complete